MSIMPRDEQGAIEATLFPLSDFSLVRESGPSVSATCNAGDIAESRFLFDAKSRGLEVFLPFGHSTKCDCIVKFHQCRPIMVQIKKATFQRPRSSTQIESWKFMVGSGKPSCAANPMDFGKRFTKYESGDFDVLAAFIQERDSWAFYRLENVVGKSCIRWSFGDSENNWCIFGDSKPA